MWRDWLRFILLILPFVATRAVHHKPATVLSADDDRYAHTYQYLETLGFVVTRFKQGWNSSSPDIVSEAREIYGSNNIWVQRSVSATRAWLEMVDEFAQNCSVPLDSWRFFFVDEVVLHPSLDVHSLDRLLGDAKTLARTDGFFTMGACGSVGEPACSVHITPDYALCSSTCLLAVALTRRRAQTLFIEARFLVESVVRSRDVVARTRADMWVKQLHQYRPGLAAGINLPSPLRQNAFGLFYQDSTRFDSSVTGVFDDEPPPPVQELPKRASMWWALSLVSAVGGMGLGGAWCYSSQQWRRCLTTQGSRW